MGESIAIDIRTPEKWAARGFWAWRRRRTFGVVLAFSPAIFAAGFEVLNGYGKGVAIMAGPLWLGFITAKIDQEATDHAR
jgi:hypothetical protein